MNKWCEQGKHWGTSLFPLTSGRPLIIICAYCGKVLRGSRGKAK